MIKKMGRPTTNPKDYQIKIRATKEQVERLEYLSKKMNVSKTEVMIKGLDLVYAQEKE